MTLQDFIKITKHIGTQSYMRTGRKPDAVCVSRKIFIDLSTEIRETLIIYSEDGEITDDAQLCGLMLFVDDTMPDEYFEVGYMKQFIDYFAKRKKTIEGN